MNFENKTITTANIKLKSFKYLGFKYFNPSIEFQHLNCKILNSRPQVLETLQLVNNKYPLSRP